MLSREDGMLPGFCVFGIDPNDLRDASLGLVAGDEGQGRWNVSLHSSPLEDRAEQSDASLKLLRLPDFVERRRLSLFVFTTAGRVLFLSGSCFNFESEPITKLFTPFVTRPRIPRELGGAAVGAAVRDFKLVSDL
mmetsp:Transcript_12801/g.26429  ORF Transcript_12801/g.26429 Transcript_12801/m.26429 type:complete len:135 (+) Transcript_12801:1225-1629(+)